MKITQVGSNQTMLTLKDDTRIFFSYNTAVIISIPDQPAMVTNEKYGQTTSKHINSWLKSSAINNFELVSQEIIDGFLEHLT